MDDDLEIDVAGDGEPAADDLNTDALTDIGELVAELHGLVEALDEDARRDALERLSSYADVLRGLRDQVADLVGDGKVQPVQLSRGVVKGILDRQHQPEWKQEPSNLVQQILDEQHG